MKSPFWPLPSTFLTGSALAAGLALINSLGNFAGYLGRSSWAMRKTRLAVFRPALCLGAAAFVSTLTALGCALWMPRGRYRLGGWRRRADKSDARQAAGCRIIAVGRISLNPSGSARDVPPSRAISRTISRAVSNVDNV